MTSNMKLDWFHLFLSLVKLNMGCISTLSTFTSSFDWKWWNEYKWGIGTICRSLTGNIWSTVLICIKCFFLESYVIFDLIFYHIFYISMSCHTNILLRCSNNTFLLVLALLECLSHVLKSKFDNFKQTPKYKRKFNNS